MLSIRPQRVVVTCVGSNFPMTLMKRLLAVLLSFGGLGFFGHARAQGTVNFANRIPGTVDARILVSFADGSSVGADAHYVAQLYASAPGGILEAVGEPIPFRSTSEAAKGYWVGEARTIAGVAENGTAQVQVRAWDQRQGTTYEQATSTPFGFGSSAIIQVTTGGGLTPPQPLIGLTGFSMQGYILPEPAVVSLGLVGTLVLWRGNREKKRQRSDASTASTT